MQNDADNVYMRKSMACFAVDSEKLFMVKLSNLVPRLIPVLTLIAKSHIKLTGILNKMLPSFMNQIEEQPPLWIIKQVETVVKERLASGKRRTDLLQLMLDATMQDEVKVSYQKIFLTLCTKRIILSHIG